MNKVTIAVSLVFFLSSQKISAVEGMKPDVTYPLTAPSELFKEIEEWQYVKTYPHIFSPIFHFITETDKLLNYNVILNTGFSYSNTKYILEAGRKGLSLFDSTKIDYAKSSFRFKDNYISVGYRNSSWFDLRKEIFSLSTYSMVESKDYTSEIAIDLNRFSMENNYTLSYSIHKLYSYENMFTIGFAYYRSHFLIDRKRMIQVELCNRFAYNDYLFATPGIKAGFLSQRIFTPFIRTIYLASKNVSFKAEFNGRSYEANFYNSYNIPYTAFPESLKASVNLIKGALEIEAVIDTSMLVKASMSARKTRYPLYTTEKEVGFLSYENMDTVINFISMFFDIKISKKLFTLNTKLSFGYTPFYEKRIPYSPNYQLSMDIGLHPLIGVSFSNNIQYVGRIYDSQEREIKPFFIFSPSFSLRIMKNISLYVGILNATDNKERFIEDVYFYGRVIKGGMKISF